MTTKEERQERKKIDCVIQMITYGFLARMNGSRNLWRGSLSQHLWADRWGLVALLALPEIPSGWQEVCRISVWAGILLAQRCSHCRGRSYHSPKRSRRFAAACTCCPVCCGPLRRRQARAERALKVIPLPSFEAREPVLRKSMAVPVAFAQVMGSACHDHN